MRLIHGTSILAAIGLVSFMALPGSAMAKVNVNENGNAVLCKGKTCKWLKPACKEEGGTYTQGAGGTGKCNFPGKVPLGLTSAEPKSPAKKGK